MKDKCQNKDERLTRCAVKSPVLYFINIGNQSQSPTQ